MNDAFVVGAGTGPIQTVLPGMSASYGSTSKARCSTMLQNRGFKRFIPGITHLLLFYNKCCVSTSF